MSRTDIHRPSAIQPDDYEYIACDTRMGGDPLLDAIARREQQKLIQGHMAVTGGKYSKHAHGGDCHVCGASFIDSVVWYHAPSNSYVRTGMDCADKLGSWDRKAFERVRTERQALERAKAGKLKASGLLRERGLVDAVEALYVNRNIGGDVLDPCPESYPGVDTDILRRAIGWVGTATDIVTKLIRYGELSEKQWGFLASLLERLETIPELQAKRDAEQADSVPAPEGRVEVEGKVLTLKWQESPWGDTLKMLVKDDRGFKVWTTCPSSLDAEQGDRVHMTVTLEPKADDPSFAIGKRPSKASVIEAAA